MKALIAAVLLILVSGCSTLSGGAGANEAALKVLSNLEHCDRQYTIALGVGAAGSLNINCKAKPYDQ